MAYITTTDLREYLDQVKTGVAVDAELTKVINRAHDIVTQALGFEFATYGVAAAKDVRAWGGGFLNLPAHETGGVTSVYSVSSKATDYETTSEITDYVEMDDGRLWRGNGWCGDAWYRVTAPWGYGPAPNSVVEVELEAAVNIWRGRDAAVWQSEVGAEGQGSVPFNRALSWAQRDYLAAVRVEYEGIVHA